MGSFGPGLGRGRLDRAGRVEVPEGVRLVFLPPHSPELQPVERVWPLLNEAVVNRYFQDLEERFIWGRGPKDDGGGGRTVPGPCPGPRDLHWWPRTRVKGYYCCPPVGWGAGPPLVVVGKAICLPQGLGWGGPPHHAGEWEGPAAEEKSQPQDEKENRRLAPAAWRALG